MVKFIVKWLNLLLRTFQVDHDYHYMFNATRYDIMMNVREELMNIAKENDKAYGMYRGKTVLESMQIRRCVLRFVFLTKFQHASAHLPV